MKMQWMRRGKQILATSLMVAVLCACAQFPVSATGTADREEELSEEEQAMQEELEKVYEMPVQTNEVKGWPKGPGTYGEAAIIMEVGTGAILYAKNIDDHHYPASITKVLTALVALENGKLDDTVTMSHDSVAFLQPGDSSIGLKEGNQLTLEQALYATLLASANEGAYAVGESVGKNAGHDYDWFIQQMNQRCKELGGENSNFVNTNGLHDPNHYTCARDMALIGRELFKHPEFFEIVQTLNYTIPATDTCEEHVFQQKHKMLQPENSNYYKYAVGGKTGYTSDALATLITMADNGTTQLVCVVLRTHGGKNYPDTKALLDYGFDNFTKTEIDGNETSKDVGDILTDEGGGYVMLPKGVAFEDLELEILPDNKNNGEATLNYTYEGNLVGTARAKLSDSYVDAHTAKIKETKESEAGKEDQMSRGEKIFLAGAVALLVILIVAFVWLILKRKRRRRRRRRR